MAKEKKLKKVPVSQVRTFKIKNRRGCAAICRNNLTEGVNTRQALDRMNKALKRMGYILEAQ
ncbi:MAG: hypothetical protein U9R44_04965 [Candidatus Omnitrophota bacterium]|nr:hypothetical protein [Candidatus Omnitrophota bacterium]